MPMVQPIDGGALINALRAGREDRELQEKHEMEKRAMEADIQRQGAVSSVLSQMFSGGTQPMGVQEQLLGPDNRPINGARSASSPSAAPRPDMRMAGQLMMLDPEMAAKIMPALKTMTDIELDQATRKNDTMALAAHYLMSESQDPRERAQLLQYVIPQLKQAGFTDQEIAQADLSDQSLRALMGFAVDYDTMFDNERQRRELEWNIEDDKTDNAREDRRVDVLNETRRTSARASARNAETNRMREERIRSSGGSGGSSGGSRTASPKRPTATDANGNKVEWDGKAWVPVKG